MPGNYRNPKIVLSINSDEERKMTLNIPDKYRDYGLLALRIGYGIMYVFHGFPKISGGPERWAGVGGAISNFGIEFLPVFWGFMAAISEFFGGILLTVGFFFRPACALMAITMIVATGHHLGRGDGLMGASHAIENGIVLLSLILIGPGKFSLDSWIGGRRETIRPKNHGISREVS
jgi:putative oxidoreductase